MARHSAHDGKGWRDVYVDGVKLDHCYWADDTRGVAKCLRYPFQVDQPRRRMKTCVHRGKVEVRPSG